MIQKVSFIISFIMNIFHNVLTALRAELLFKTGEVENAAADAMRDEAAMVNFIVILIVIDFVLCF